METTPVHSPTLDNVISESNRIIGANYCQFFALSLLFIPLSLSLITSSPVFQLVAADDFQPFPINHLIYIVLVYLLTLSAIATITYTTYHRYSGKPVNFFTTLNSMTISFIRIIITAIIAHVILFQIFLAIGTSVKMIQNLGFFVIDYKSSLFSALVGGILCVIVVYFYVNWSLAFVVVVVESKWGFAALKRSSNLVKGMRSVSFLLLLLFGFYSGITIWVISDTIPRFSSWGYIWFAKILGSSMLISYLLHITVANAVLYNYCKAFHGELELDGFITDHNYINLPCDDDKTPHVTNVVAV